MNDITLLDNYGNVLHYFTQWDINQMIYIEESGFSKAPQFHFQNLKTTEAYVVQSSMDSNGNVSVMVPNEFTVVAYPIDIYIYVSDSDSSQTVYHVTIPVYPRKQPNNLIYEDNMEFIMITELEERIEELKGILDGFSVTAKDISYNNITSGLDATNVQDALDELVEKYVFVDKEFNGGSGDNEVDNGDGDNENTDNTKKDGVTNSLDDITLYEPIYLYNYGDTAEQLGGWNTEMYYYDWQGKMYKDVGTISVKENSDHIYFNASSYNNYYASMSIHSKNTFDWNELAPSEYAYKFNAKYGVLGAYTEEDLTTFANIWCSNSESSVTTQIMLAFMDSSNNNIFTMKSGNGYDELFEKTDNSVALEFDINTTPAAHAFQLYQLYLTPEGTDYFIDAWKVIEEAINSMMVTNDTTVEDIQTVVDNALSNASLKGYVHATVESSKLEKVLASSIEEGYISGDISIISMPESHLMEFTKIIAKIQEGSEDSDESDIDISKVTDMIYLYNEGVESDLIGGFSVGLHYMDEDTCTLSKESDHILFSTSEYSSGWANLCTNKNPDLTNYNICGVEYDYTGEALSDDTSIFKMFCADTNSATDSGLTGIMHPFIIQEGENLLVTREMPKSFYLTSTSYLIFNFSCFGYKPAGELKIRKIWVGKYDLDGMDEDDNSGDTSDDATKVSNAKYVIEETINNMSVNNTTNTSDIQSVVDNALTEASITNVTVTVKDVVNTNATTETTGTITGTVDIVCGTASDTVDINKTIAQMLEADVAMVSAAKTYLKSYYNYDVSTLRLNATEEQCLASSEYGMDFRARYSSYYNGEIGDITISLRDFIKDEENRNISFDVIINCGTCYDVVSISKKAYNHGYDTDEEYVDMLLTYFTSYMKSWNLSDSMTNLYLEASCINDICSYGEIINISNFAITACTGLDALGSVSGTIAITFNGVTKNLDFSEVIREIPDNGEVVYLYNEGEVSSWCGEITNSVSSSSVVTNSIKDTCLVVNCSDYEADEYSTNTVYSTWKFSNRLNIGNFSKLYIQYDFTCEDIADSGSIILSPIGNVYYLTSLSTITESVSDATVYGTTMNDVGGLGTDSYVGFRLSISTPVKACTLTVKKIWLEP